MHLTASEVSVNCPRYELYELEVRRISIYYISVSIGRTRYHPNISPILSIGKRDFSWRKVTNININNHYTSLARPNNQNSDSP